VTSRPRDSRDRVKSDTFSFVMRLTSLMKPILTILAFAAILPAQITAPAAPAPTPAPSANPNEVVISVGDRQITVAQYEQLVKKLLPPQQQAGALGPDRRQIAQRLVELSVLAAAAEKQSLDKQPDLALQLAWQRDNLLAVAMYQNMEDNFTIPDAAIQAYYDAHKADYETITARHILVRVKGAPFPGVPGKPELSDDEARAKAEAIRKRIAGGEDFAKIAKEESDDTTSGAAGGDLGEIRHGTQVPPFEQAAFALKPGDVSEPVQTPFGYHIIQVQSHSVKSLADVRDDVVAQLKPDLAHQAIDDMVGKTKVNISESYFGPAPPVAAPAPGAK